MGNEKPPRHARCDRYSPSLKGPSPEAVALSGVTRFIAWHLMHPFYGNAGGAQIIFLNVEYVWATALRPKPP